jgi:hypothetical protein
VLNNLNGCRSLALDELSRVELSWAGRIWTKQMMSPHKI